MIKPQPAPVAISAADARKLAENLMDVMTSLLGVIENETALVRAGKLREAIALEGRKTELSQRYSSIIAFVRNNQNCLAKASPDLIKALHRHHDTFRAMLQVNLTVLATAHAVSEGVIRGVNAEMQKRAMPQTYTAAGQRSSPYPNRAAPLSVSRSL
jgi:Mrp family chromosome partitioning ATPase